MSSKVSSLLSVGGIALGLMLAAEFTFVALLRGLSVRDYPAGRDPVAGTVYYAMLGLLFAIMPLLLARRSAGRPDETDTAFD